MTTARSLEEKIEIARRRGLLDQVIASLPPAIAEPLKAELAAEAVRIPVDPVAQARELNPAYVARPHLRYLSDRLAQAVADVEAGISRRLIVSMPPRMGKSMLASIYTPVWLLRKHPDWKIMLASHSPDLAASWGREVRRTIERRPELGVAIAQDAKAVTRWETTRGGIMRSLSVGQSPTGEGAKVLLIDDPLRDFAAAHSAPARKALWEWWQADISTRLEGASLVVVTATRWHEDDLIGRLISTEYPGDPGDWEQITFPALAFEHDVLGRKPGQALLSPIIARESQAEALERFAQIRKGMTSYQWSALFEQSPAPAQGAIFNVGWWRYWTRDPGRATDDGMVRYLDPDELAEATVVDSWDATFKATTSSDYVVGQRWARIGANRFLLDQRRGRWTFTQTLEQMRGWLSGGTAADRVRRRLIEDKANGPAIIDALRDEIAGLKPINPRGSKEARARAVTPEIESGNVYLPNPDEPGNEWVRDLLDEARSFPTGRHDDQVDAMTQALDELHDAGPVELHAPPSRPQPRATPPSSFLGARRGR